MTTQPAHSEPLMVHRELPVLSDEAMHHLSFLLTHRPDMDKLVVELHPDQCQLCRWIEGWAKEVTGIARGF